MKNHYRLFTFYKRSHDINLHMTREELSIYLKNKTNTNKALHYTEIWEMLNEDDGKQIMLLRNSNIEFLPK